MQQNILILAISGFAVFVSATIAQESPSTIVTGGRIQGARLNAGGAYLTAFLLLHPR